MVKRMKIKKIRLVRPEIECELQKPFISRLYLLAVLPRFIIIKPLKYTVLLTKDNGMRGHGIIKKQLVIAIPKIKVLKAFKEVDAL